ncbi:MAG: tyrosine-type recombinase/integrase [Candidatus Limnocylindria bacterium]
MAKRLPGEGTLRERPNGTWEARYRAADGRQRSIYAKTRGEAAARLKAALRQRDAGLRPVDERLTLGDFLDDWLAHQVEPSRRPRTAESYRDVVRLYIKPELGRMPLARLEPEHVQAMLARLQGRRGALSATSRRYVYTVLRIALGHALRLGRVHRNVCTLIDPPSRSQRELRPLSRPELARFLTGIRGDRLEALYVTAIGTGLRQGELLALRWSDVNLERGELVVRHTLQRGARVLAQPKTERARRTLRLASAVRGALLAHRERQAIVALSGLVFTTTAGGPIDGRVVARAFRRHLVRLGLPHQRFHDLRHAFATLMIEAGEDLGVVSRILGHADFSTTADVYAHLTPAMLDRAAARMDDVLGAAGAER